MYIHLSGAVPTFLFLFLSLEKDTRFQDLLTEHLNEHLHLLYSNKRLPYHYCFHLLFLRLSFHSIKLLSVSRLL